MSCGLKLDQNILRDVESAIRDYANIVPVDDLLGLDSDDWMLITLQVVHKSPIECVVFWLSAVYCLLYGRMPDEVVHRFGYPQQIVRVAWDMVSG